MRTFSLIIISLLFFACGRNENRAPYKNPDLAIEKRVDDLLSRMTPEEKFWQMFMIPGNLEPDMAKYKNGIFGLQVSAKGRSGNAAGQMLEYGAEGTPGEVADRINNIQRYFIEETRLGIPLIPFDEALHGLVREGATAFPQSIALAATWNTELMGEVAASIADETKSRGIRQILSPVVNIARDVRWGRTEETYGEDPFLSARMGVAFVSEFEKRGIISTPKHFVANVGDGGRDSYPIHYNERLMEEIYFPAFRACFKEGGSRSVMTSYNSYDGSPCTANSWLLRDKLKGEWGFDGFVISDAGATGGANVLHFTAKDYPGSTANSINAGLDVLFQTSFDHYPLFWPAFRDGLITSENIDKAVRRILKAKFELGLFENPYVNPEDAVSLNGSAVNRETALRAARESIVLLKNKGILPLSEKVKKVTLIGVDAKEARLGGYSGPGNRKLSVYKALKEQNSDYELTYAEGPGRNDLRYIAVPQNVLKMPNSDESGLKGEYYNNNSLAGDPVLTRKDSQIHFGWTLFSPDTLLAYDWYSVRWTGSLRSPLSGMYEIGLEGNDGYRMYIEDELIIDNWQKKSYSRITENYYFESGKEYKIRIEFFESTGNARIKLIWNQGLERRTEYRINEAVKLAREAEVAVVVVGIEEGEFRDRASLALPGAQEELILKIAETGTPMVVIIVGGSAVTMQSWYNKADAILDIWYPGDMGGQAVAEILKGDYSPAGRLPITFPMDEAQLPLYYNHKPTGRGDDYLNLTGHPLFPFGFGLSYTSFEYSDLELSDSNINAGETVKITCRVKNTGAYDGDEVVQLYIRDEIASVARPVMELKGFQRVHIKKGESEKLIFELGKEELEMLDINMKRVIEPGAFRIMIGASSRDIRLRTHLYVN